MSFCLGGDEGVGVKKTHEAGSGKGMADLNTKVRLSQIGKLALKDEKGRKAKKRRKGGRVKGGYQSINCTSEEALLIEQHD
jgi:hypothetical protein